MDTQTSYLVVFFSTQKLKHKRVFMYPVITHSLLIRNKVSLMETTLVGNVHIKKNAYYIIFCINLFQILWKPSYCQQCCCHLSLQCSTGQANPHSDLGV